MPGYLKSALRSQSEFQECHGWNNTYIWTDVAIDIMLKVDTRQRWNVQRQSVSYIGNLLRNRALVNWGDVIWLISMWYRIILCTVSLQCIHACDLWNCVRLGKNSFHTMYSSTAPTGTQSPEWFQNCHVTRDSSKNRNMGSVTVVLPASLDAISSIHVGEVDHVPVLLNPGWFWRNLFSPQGGK